MRETRQFYHIRSKFKPYPFKVQTKSVQSSIHIRSKVKASRKIAENHWKNFIVWFHQINIPFGNILRNGVAKLRRSYNFIELKCHPTYQSLTNVLYIGSSPWKVAELYCKSLRNRAGTTII